MLLLSNRRMATKYDHITMFGASHVRYNYDYVLAKCYGDESLKTLNRKHDSFAIGNTNFKRIWQVPLYN